MTESEFNQRVDDTLMRLEEALDNCEADLDYGMQAGVMQITVPSGRKLILNRQTPVRQLWLATPEGGYHFDWQDGDWYERKQGLSLWPFLARSLGKLLGQEVSL